MLYDYYTTGLLTAKKTYVKLITENREARSFGKDIQMFNNYVIFATAEYERDFVSYVEREGFSEMRPYENGKNERLNTPG